MATGTLTNTSIKDRYKSLLKLTGTGNDTLSATAASAKVVEDGDGNDSPLALSQSRVGIGTNAPESTLHIHSADNTAIDTADGTNSNTHANYGLLIRNSSTTQYSFAGLAFDTSTEADDDSTSASIAAVRMQSGTASHHNAALTFNTNDGDASSDDKLLERMRIADDGKVGIGTNSPDVDLHIESTTTSSTLLDITSKNDGTNADVGVRFFHGASPVLKGSVGYNAQTEVIMITAGNNFNNSHLSINSSGNIGIGTTAPGARLGIAGTDATGTLELLRIDTSIDGADVELGSIYFSGCENANGTTNKNIGAAIKTFTDEAWDASDDFGTRMQFYTADNGGSSALNFAMGIDSTGNVGIGIVEPLSTLAIKGGVNAAPPSSSTTSNAVARFETTTTGLALDIGADSSGTDRVWIEARGNTGNLATTANLAINQNGGNVGIGTASPVYPLQVAAAGGADLGLHRADTSISDGNQLGTIKFTGAGGESATTDVFVGAMIRGEAAATWESDDENKGAELQFFTQDDNDSDALSSPRMTINKNGNVGIGTDDPGSLLTLEGTNADALIHASSGSAYLKLDAHSTSDSCFIEFKVADSRKGYIEYDFNGTPTDELMIFEVNNAKRMFIKGDGNVGIGTDNPISLLHVSGNEATDYVATFHNDGSHVNRYGIKIIAGPDDSGSTADTEYDADGEIRWIALEDGDGHTQAYLQYKHATNGAIVSSVSDARLKENIKDTEINGLSSINALKLREFNWKRGGNKIKVGLIAQEVESIPDISDMVSNMGAVNGLDDTKGVGWDASIPYLIKAVQELSAKVEALENQ